MHKKISLALAGLFVAGSAQAFDINVSSLAQPAFRALSEDLGSALSYKPNTPTEPLAGLIPFGFDIGVAMTSTKLAHSDAYASALDGDSTVYLPTVRAQVGLPFGIDIGAAYLSAGDFKYTGGELRYAILKGGIATPALGVRGSFSKLSGVKDFEFGTKGLDISVSKGVLMATPYIGAGKVWVSSKTSPTAGGFDESFSQNKLFAGVGFNMLLLNLNIEADKTGDAKSYSAKLGLRF